MRHLYLSLFGCFLCIATLGQSVELNLLYSKKTEALTKGDYDNALAYGVKAVTKAKEEFGETEIYANYAGDLAQLYFQLKKYAEARALYESVLLIYQQKLGPYHVYTAVTNNNLGNLYRLAGEKALALAAYQNGLEGYRQSLTSKHEYYTMTLSTLIDFCKEAELYDVLENVYRQERTNASVPSTDNAEYIAWTNNLAMLLEEVGKPAEAEKFYKEAIEIAQKNKSVYADELPTLNGNLGQFYLTQNRLDDAEKYMLRALVPSHESYPTFVSNLGMVYERQKKFDRALDAYLKALNHLAEAGQDTSQIFRTIAYNATESLNRAGRYLDEVVLIKRALAKSISFDARLINELGIANTNLGQYARADSAFGVVMAKHNDHGVVSPHEHIRAIAGRADVWRIQGKLKDAEQILLAGIKTSLQDSVSNDKALITLRHNLSYLYKTMGEYVRAEVIARKALRKYEAQYGRDVEFANMLKNYGSLHMDLIQYEKAERFIKEAMTIEKKEIGEQSDGYSTSLNQLGLVYFYQGRYNESKAVTQQSLEIKQHILGPQHEHYANSLVNLGNVLMTEGLFEQAEPLYRQAERIYKSSSGTKTKNYANILHSLAKVKMSIGFYGEAAKLFRQTLSVSQAVVGADHPDYANALNSLGMLYREINEYDKADSAYSVSLTLRKKAGGEKSYAYGQSLNNLADLYVFMGRHREAVKMYEQCLAIAQNTVGKNHPDYATYLNNLGQAYFKDGDYGKAQQYLQSAIVLREKIYGPRNLLTLEAKSNLLAALDAQGKHTEAEKIYQFLNTEFLDYILKKFPYLAESEKTAFYSTVQYHFESFQSFALRRQKDNPAILGQLFDIQLATKALLLNSSKKVKDLVLQSTDEKLKSMYNDWLGRREYIAKAYSLPESEIVSRGIDIKKLESSADSLERALGSYSPIFQNAYAQNKVTWKDVKKNLKPGEAVIEMCRFYLFEQAWIDSVHYAALIVKHESNYPEVVTFANGKQMETRFLKYYKATIKAKINESRSWELYWAPIENKLKGVRKVYFSPDGVFNEININTLADTSGISVLDKVAVQIVTTSREIIPGKPRSASSKRMLLVGRPSYKLKDSDDDERDRGESSLSRTSRWLGDASFSDLPGTQEEVERIAAVLKNSGSVETYLGEQAREEIVKTSSDARILHIATHGFFIGAQADEFEQYKKHEDNFSNPMLRSGIVLAGVENFRSGGGQNVEDGILTAMEVCNLQLENTDLVVMSACETGLGEVRYGEGVYGLQRAFRIAGAKAMIMSLWKVDDHATQEMMVAFYTHWLKEGNMRQAFDHAQKDIRAKYKFPFYWGAFVMLSD